MSNKLHGSLFGEFSFSVSVFSSVCFLQRQPFADRCLPICCT